MTEKENPSLFDAARNMASSKKSSIPPKAPPQTPPLSEKDMEAILTKAKEYHEDLVNKLDEAYSKMGMSLKEIKAYLGNPNRFTPMQWNLIQEQRKMLIQKIRDQMGSEMESKLKKSEDSKASKERKGKTLGARKNWIPIR